MTTLEKSMTRQYFQASPITRGTRTAEEIPKAPVSDTCCTEAASPRFFGK